MMPNPVARRRQEWDFRAAGVLGPKRSLPDNRYQIKKGARSGFKSLRLFMTKLRISVGIVLTVAGVLYAGDVWATDTMSVKAPTAAAASTPKPCTDGWSFIATDCQLTWRGITV
jgi:hypothetical protein